MANMWGQQDADVNGGTEPPAPLMWGSGDAAGVAPSTPPTGAPTSTQSGSILPAAPYDTTDAAVHGLTLGLSDVGRAALMAGGRYLSGQTPDFDYGQASREIQRGREVYASEHPWLSAASNIAGASVGPAGAAADLLRAASPIGKIMAGAATGGGIGAIQGAADNSGTPSEALQGAEKGGEVGALVGGGLPLAETVARTLVPSVTPAAQVLRGAGIEPTPGAAIGGAPGVIENVLSRVPIVGAPVNAGRQAAMQQFNEAVAKNAQDFNRLMVNQALSPIGESLGADTAIGHDAIAEMAQKVGDAYHAAIPTAGGAIDGTMKSVLDNAVANARLQLPADRADQFNNFVQTNILRRIDNPTTEADALTSWQTASRAQSEAAANLAAAQRQSTLAQAQKVSAGNNVYLSSGALQAERDANAAVNDAQQSLAAATKRTASAQAQLQQARATAAPYGILSGQALKDADTDLGREANTYLSGNSTPDERKLGQAYQQLQGNLRDWIARVSPDNAADLQAANSAYSRMLRVQNAASRSTDGIFTPEQMVASVKKFSGPVQFARGGALMQDQAQDALAQKQAFSQAGQNVLRAPAGSGSHGAGVGAGVLGAELIEHLMQHPSPGMIGAAALSYPTLGALYSNPGRSAVNGLLSASSSFPSIVPLSPFIAQGAAQ